MSVTRHFYLKESARVVAEVQKASEADWLCCFDPQTDAPQ
jgi:hypothetical protein